MDVVGDLLARDRRSRDVALVTAGGSERTYHDLITNGYKAANVLRHLGAREGSTVAIDAAPRFHTVVAFLGAARLGASVRFDPIAGVDAGDRVVLAPVEDEPGINPDPGTSLAVFGGPPERPETTHWEAELWSENPGTPPSAVGPDDPVVRPPGGEAAVSHRSLLGTATEARAAHGIGEETRVVLRAALAEADAVAIGVVAPLSCGGTVVLAGGAAVDDRARGDVAVVTDTDQRAPEGRYINSSGTSRP
mgnify:CR=1 FL=1